MFDRDATLWNGYMLKRKKGNIYFAGDSGYDQDIFRKTGKDFAPIKLAMIPIGAYKPPCLLSTNNMSEKRPLTIFDKAFFSVEKIIKR